MDKHTTSETGGKPAGTESSDLGVTDFGDGSFVVDGPVAAYGDSGCLLNHLAFDVATDAEVDAFTARLRAHGYQVDEPERDRRQNKFTSPAGIHVEINTPPYMNPRPARELAHSQG